MDPISIDDAFHEWRSSSFCANRRRIHIKRVLRGDEFGRDASFVSADLLDWKNVEKTKKEH